MNYLNLDQLVHFFSDIISNSKAIKIESVGAKSTKTLTDLEIAIKLEEIEKEETMTPAAGSASAGSKQTS